MNTFSPQFLFDLEKELGAKVPRARMLYACNRSAINAARERHGLAALDPELLKLDDHEVSRFQVGLASEAYVETSIQKIKSLIEDSALLRQGHFDFGKPFTSANEGFKEANIAHDVSTVFRSAGYYVYPEFSFGGSIDAVFIEGTDVLLCEWKRLWSGSSNEIRSQTLRMLSFNSNEELARHGFPARYWKTEILWVCDVWDQEGVDWWLGLKTSARYGVYPFDADWHTGKYMFQGLNAPYWWVWAYLPRRT